MSNNKSFSGGISQRYALALLELSSETNKTDEYVSSLSNFLKIYYSDNNSENVKGTIKLKSEIDESLIGGVVLQIGSLMIDTSIKNKLASYKKVLLES